MESNQNLLEMGGKGQGSRMTRRCFRTRRRGALSAGGGHAGDGPILDIV